MTWLSTILGPCLILACSTNVVIYQDYGFSGPNQEISCGTYRSIPSPIGNRQLSSIKIPAGFIVELYDNLNFMGDMWKIKGPADIDIYTTYFDWNDRVQSMNVYRNNLLISNGVNTNIVQTQNVFKLEDVPHIQNMHTAFAFFQEDIKRQSVEIANLQYWSFVLWSVIGGIMIGMGFGVLL